MSKYRLLVKHLFREKVKAPSFIWSILIYVLIIAAVMFWQDIKEIFFQDEPIQVAVLNETDTDIQSLFESTNDVTFSFSEESQKVIEEKVKASNLDAVVVITDQNQQLSTEIATFEPLSRNNQMTLSSLLQHAGQLYQVQKLNLSAEQAEKILQSQTIITMKNLNKDSQSNKSEDEKEAGVGASFLVGFLIYSFILSFLSMITTDVASEKGSRVLEVMLASVKPVTHLLAKLTGTFLLAITQMVLLVGVLVPLLMFVDDGSKWQVVLDIVNELSVSFVIYSVIFLIVSIMIYLILGALLGSLVSKVEESSQAMMPAMIMGIIGFYVLLSGMFSPDTLLVKIFSYIPFTSGMVMPLRIGATDISINEVHISLLVLIVTTILLFILSLSFYKRSVLMYSSGGLFTKIKDIFKMTT
ncbi:MAG: ABC transporter permease [Paenisporosarcina sp.]